MSDKNIILTGGKNFERLALREIMKAKPFGALYGYNCMVNNVPVAEDYLPETGNYEGKVLLKRK